MLKNIFQAQNKIETSDKVFQRFFYTILFLFGCTFFVRIFHGYGFIIDTFEHIHSSWLISTGKVPYRDFFEHHNPLLWYLFAPFTQIFYRDINIIYIVRFLSIIGWTINLYLFYHIIKKHLFEKRIAQYSLLFILLFPFIWKDIQNFRPDTFMLTFLLLGLENFYRYIQNKKLLNLTISYFCIAIGFLFLQKIIIPASGLALANIWLLLKKELKLRDIIKALIPSLILLSSFFYTLYTANALDDWFQFNIILNSKLINYYGDFTSNLPLEHMEFLILAGSIITAYISKYQKQDITWILILSCLTISTLIFAPYPQYFIIYLLFTAPYVGYLWQKININEYIKHIFLLLCIITSLNTLLTIKEETKAVEKQLALAEFILKNTTADEEILNGQWNYAVNLFNKDTNYFGFGYCSIVKISTLENIRPFIWDRVVKKQNPKFLLINKNETPDKILYKNTTWLRERNQKILQNLAKYDNWKNYYTTLNYSCYNEDWDYIHQNYRWIEIKPKVGLWIRKDIKDLVY